MKVLRNLLTILAGQILAVAANAAPLQFCDASEAIKELTTKTQNLNPQVLQLAVTAYNCALKFGYQVPPMITIIDYTLPSNQKRLWVVSLDNNKQVRFNTLVAHGKGSGDSIPNLFSNTPESHQSSVGLFLTGDIYQGKHGSSLRLKGLEMGFNDKALARATVIHGAYYVSAAIARKFGKIGRSWGCPAVPQTEISTIISLIKGGTLVFAYSNQPKWLKESKFLHCGL